MPYKKEWVEPELLLELAGENDSMINIYRYYEDDDVELPDDLRLQYKHVDKDGDPLDEGVICAPVPTAYNISIGIDWQSYTLGYLASLIDTGSLKDMKELD